MSLWCNVLVRLKNSQEFIIQTVSLDKYKYVFNENDFLKILDRKTTKYRYVKKLGSKTFILESNKYQNDLFFYNKIEKKLYGNGLIIFDFKYNTTISCILNDDIFNYDIGCLFKTNLYKSIKSGKVKNKNQIERFFNFKGNQLDFLEDKGEVFLFSEFCFLNKHLQVNGEKLKINKNEIFKELIKIEKTLNPNKLLKIKNSNNLSLYDYNVNRTNKYIKDFF